MGGFTEYDGNRPVRVLLPEQLQSYSLTGNGDFPKVSKAEIEDKIKGDTIAKVAVIMQTSWFVMQCIARVVQGLPITELELVTVAFATLNFVLYMLWWHKPQNVQRGVRVYKQRITEQPIDDGDVEADVGFWDALGEALSALPAAIADGPIIRKLPRASWLWRVYLWPFTKPLDFLCLEKPKRKQGYENLKKVSTFYPDEWPTGRTMVVGLAFVAAIASVFGGIHCLGWVFAGTERNYWRLASISITAIPLTFFLSYLPRPTLAGKYPALLFILDGLLNAQISYYLLYRLALLLLPLVTLKSLPPAAYHIVHWTSFIPHV